MSSQAKTIAGVAVVAVVGLLALVMMGPLVALLVLVAGGLAVVVVLQRSNDGVAKLPSRSRSRGRSRNDDDTTDLLRSATSTVQPLTTWTPPDALAPWTPPTGIGDEETSSTGFAPPAPEAPSPNADFWSTEEAALTDFSDLAEPAADESTSWLDEPITTDDAFTTQDTVTTQPDAWQDGSTWDDSNVTVEGNPLDDLARLDDIDVIAELERLDGNERTDTGPQPKPSLFGAPSDFVRINEDVSSADDIMAASQATELQVEQEDNSELAKLLAKVQARLAAYE